MIDIWLLFVAFVPFAEVFLHTKMSMILEKQKMIQESCKVFSMRDAKEQDKQLKKYQKELEFFQKLATIGLPLIALIFLITFFAIGFIFLSQ